jgi:ABC-type glycerol-3-phosphate transport system substrate-binding protein
LARAVKAGTVPDIIQVGSTWLAPLMEMAAIRPWPDAALEPLAAPSPIARAMADATRIQGYRWGVPWFLDFRVLYQRGGGTEAPFGHDAGAFDRFVDSLSVDAPWLIPAEPEPSLVHILAMWLWSHGAELPPRRTAAVEWADAIGRLYEVGRRGGLAAEGAWLSAPQANTAFYAGGVGTWLISRPRAVETPNGLHIRAFPRTGCGPNVYVGGSYLCVTARPRLHPEAFVAARFLTTVESQSQLSQASTLWPATDGAAIPTLQPPVEPDVLEAVAHGGRNLPTAAEWQYVEELTAQGFGRILRRILQGAAWPDVRAELDVLDRNYELLRAVTLL